MPASESMASSVNSSVTPFGRHQRDVLLDQAGFGLGQDALEIVLLQRPKFDADRQAALQFGQQVGRLGDMERAGGDEQDVIGLHRPVFGRNRRALDQRQQVALHALRATGRPAAILRAAILSISSRKTMPSFSADSAPGRPRPGRAACRTRR
jgi:hypothetical protein